MVSSYPRHPAELVQKLAHLDYRQIPAPNDQMEHPALHLVDNWVERMVQHYQPKNIPPEHRALASAFASRGASRFRNRLQRTFEPGIYATVSKQVKVRYARQKILNPPVNRIDLDIIRSILNETITALLKTCDAVE